MNSSSQLQLKLFGSPQVLYVDEPMAQDQKGLPPVAITDRLPGKAQALLYYVAATRPAQTSAHSREVLAALLWPNASYSLAGKSLRNRLSELRKEVGHLILITRRTVGLHPEGNLWLDVAQFQAAITCLDDKVSGLARLRAAVDLYVGDFLDGFHLRDALPFDEWAMVYRDQLREQMFTVLQTLADHYESQVDYALSLNYISRLLTMDPWREEAHLHKMRLLARSGQRSAALLQYETCRQMLSDEFGVAPLPATTILFEQIRQGQWDGVVTELRDKALLVREQGSATQGVGSRQAQGDGTSSITDPSLSAVHVPATDLNMVPRSIKLFGRQSELALLTHWATDECCQLVSIVGMGGQGKTALAVELTRQLAMAAHPHNFERVLWCSLLNAPPLSEVLTYWLRRLMDVHPQEIPLGSDLQLNLLMSILQRQRCLLVLDNVESILNSDKARAGYEGYEQLLERLGTMEHQGCCLLTGRVTPKIVVDLAESTPAVRLLPLAGLDLAMGIALLHAHGVEQASVAEHTLVERYSGNPLGLKLAACTIRDFFGGHTTAFLAENTLFFDDIHIVLREQFANLTAQEQTILIWLAIMREPTSFAELWNLLVQPKAKREVMNTLRSLQHRALLESQGERLTLQNVIIEFVSEHLIETLCCELLDESLTILPDHRTLANYHMDENRHHAAISSSGHRLSATYLNQYALIVAQAKDYVCVSQKRLLLAPIAQILLQKWDKAGIIQRARTLLEQLRGVEYTGSGYVAANLLHLMLYLQIDVSGFDFSRLSIRQADLRQAKLHNVNLTGASLRDSTFRETFGVSDRIATSQDGRLLAAAGHNGDVRVWELASGQPCALLRGHMSAVYGVAFSPNGTILATGSGDHTARLWDVATGRLLDTLVHTAGVYSIVFSPDGQFLATSGYERALIIWDLASKEQRARLPVDAHWIRSMAISPDGQFLASGGTDCVVHLWDIDGYLLHILVGHREQVTAVAFSPDGHTLASSSDDGTIRLWSVADGQERQVFNRDGEVILSVAFSPDGRLLAGAGDSRLISLWDIEHGRQHQVLQAHTECVWSIAFAPGGENGAILASSGRDYAIRLWSVLTGRLLRTLQGQADWHQTLSFHPCGRIVASGGTDASIHIWDTERERPQATLNGHTRPIVQVAFSPDGKTLASGSADQTIRLWDMASRRPLRMLQGHYGWVHSVAFSPDGETLASASGDMTVRLWHLVSGREQCVLRGHTNTVWSVTFSPNGQTIASASNDRTVRLWDLDGELRGILPHAVVPTKVAFNPNGRTLASSGGDQVIWLWEIAAESIRQTLDGHTGAVHALAFSHDGQFLASCSDDWTICLWDAEDGELLSQLHGHTGAVLALAINRQASVLASGSADGTIRLWDLPTATCIRVLQAAGPYAGMNITGVTGITATQKAMLPALGAVTQ